MRDPLPAFARSLSLELGRRPRTIERYTRVMQEFLSFLDEEGIHSSLPLDSLPPEAVQRFLIFTAQTEKSPSAASWNLRVTALSAFFRFLERHGVTMTTNPTKHLIRKKKQITDSVPLSFDEMLALVEAVQSSPRKYRSRNLALFQVLMHTGLRVTEVASLTLDQVDLSHHRFLNVPAKGGKVVVKEFNDVVHEALDRYLKDRYTFDLLDEQTALFLSDRGTRLSVRTIQELVSSYGRKAGISRRVTPHLLRKSFATGLAEEGVSVYDIKDALNHASIETTQLYIQMSPSRRRLATETFGRRWKEESTRTAKATTPRPPTTSPATSPTTSGATSPTSSTSSP